MSKLGTPYTFTKILFTLISKRLIYHLYKGTTSSEPEKYPCDSLDPNKIKRCIGHVLKNSKHEVFGQLWYGPRIVHEMFTIDNIINDMNNKILQFLRTH